jgi:hypothetical protein
MAGAVQSTVRNNVKMCFQPTYLEFSAYHVSSLSTQTNTFSYLNYPAVSPLIWIYAQRCCMLTPKKENGRMVMATKSFISG